MIYSFFNKILFGYMKRKKIYLCFFYGSNQELTKAFTKITNGDFVRYIMTAETLICRFKSNKPLDEIVEILRQNCPDIPFFVFPISNKKWRYNIPLDVENNLLTDNPIIQTPEIKAINQLFLSMFNEIKRHQPGIINENNPDFVRSATDQLGIRLKQAISEDNFELAAQIRDKIKELNQQKNNIKDELPTGTK